jgi:hypothetical protein
VRLVREKVGGGSNTTITPFLRKWKEVARAARNAGNLQLDPAISDLIVAQLVQAAAEAANDSNLRAREAEEAFDELSGQAAELEARLAARDGDLAATRAQIQQQQWQLQERVREIEELRASSAAAITEADERAAHERQQAESVSQLLVRANLRLEHLPNLEDELDKARKQVATSNDETARARQSEAVAIARAEAQCERAREAAAREARLAVQLERLQDERQEERQQAREAEQLSQTELLRLTRLASALDARFALQQAEIEQLRLTQRDEPEAVPPSTPPSDQRRAA